jgi:hypothetical protein
MTENIEIGDKKDRNPDLKDPIVVAGQDRINFHHYFYVC